MTCRVLTTVSAWVFTAALASAAELPASLVDPYLRIQTMLAADKTDALKAEAAQIAKAATELGNDATRLGDAARRLESATNLKTARDGFGTLSDALFAYAKTTKATNPAEIKTAYCPMAGKSWLQRGETIQNPYYGSEMLECGEMKKE